jgi:hypothetical protein
VQPHVPVALETIVHRAMARDMDQRFPDVKSFLEALEDLVRVDVSYAPNKISAGHSGRVIVGAGDRGSDRTDASGGSGRGGFYPLSAAGSSPMELGPVTPPAPGVPIPNRGGERTGTVPRFRSLQRALPIAAAVGLVAAVIALAVVRARHDQPREEVGAAAPPVAAAPQRPAPPSLSELVVVVSPAGARITVDGLPVEGNPFTGHFRKDRIHEIGASAAGYEPKTQGVVLAKDLVVTLNLDRKKPSGAPPAHGLAIRRAPEPRRAARASSPDRDLAPELPGLRAAALTSPAPSSPSVAPPAPVVSPSGGRAPIHPIQTTSPYETP